MFENRARLIPFRNSLLTARTISSFAHKERNFWLYAKLVLAHNQICKAMQKVPSSDLVNLHSISSLSLVLPSLKDTHLSSPQWCLHLPPVQSADSKSPYFYLIVGRQPLIGSCPYRYTSSNIRICVLPSQHGPV